MIKNKEVLSSPSKFFNSPTEVLQSPDFNWHEKHVALTNWKNYILQVEKGAFEGFGINSQDLHLERVNEALTDLENNRGEKENAETN